MSNPDNAKTAAVFYPQVSVIIPIYNGEADLPDLIECLRSQTYPRQGIEYLLVNNNSSDRTLEIINTAASAASEGLKLAALREDNIQSSYAARNQGIRAARGEILVFTDADCRPLPDWVEQIVQPFVKPEVGIVVGELIALPGNSLLEKYAERYKVMSPKFLLEHPFCAYGQTANLAVRRQILQQVGLFRPYLTTGGDADICWRIQRDTHWKLVFNERAIVRHRHRSNLKELRSQWRRYGQSNKYLHELYDIDLMRDFTLQEVAYRLSRWLFKEIPKNTFNLIRGKAHPLDLIKMPIDLLNFQARSAGQKTAKLPEKAREIEWLV
jgi:cellulose synthase/poly-beta-1,6-N-acetylglucosamine synthase-like glycosyltransferase